MISLILVAALNTAAAAPPAADKAPQRSAGTGCSATTLQLAADSIQPPQPAPCPKPYLMANPGGVVPIEPRDAEPMPNLYSQPARCGPLGEAAARRIKTSSQGRSVAQYAVLRTLDGCPLPAPAGYRPDYLMPGAADPVRRGDAPADRR